MQNQDHRRIRQLKHLKKLYLKQLKKCLRQLKLLQRLLENDETKNMITACRNLKQKCDQLIENVKRLEKRKGWKKITTGAFQTATGTSSLVAVTGGAFFPFALFPAVAGICATAFGLTSIAAKSVFFFAFRGRNKKVGKKLKEINQRTIQVDKMASKFVPSFSAEQEKCTIALVELDKIRQKIASLDPERGSVSQSDPIVRNLFGTLKKAMGVAMDLSDGSEQVADGIALMEVIKGGEAGEALNETIAQGLPFDLVAAGSYEALQFAGLAAGIGFVLGIKEIHTGIKDLNKPASDRVTNLLEISKRMQETIDAIKEAKHRAKVTTDILKKAGKKLFESFKRSRNKITQNI